MTDEKIIGMLSIGAPIRKGPQGPIGPVGPTGATGPQGLTGPRGEQGEKGETGERGPAGERGRMGEQGPKGDIGPKGERGPVGPMGMQGIQGIPGPRGEAGPQGPRGAVGPQGERGNDGFTGAQGAIGPRGPQGIQGERGEKGERGDGLRVIGTVDKESDIQEPKRPGDIYYVTSRNELVVYTGTKWVNLGQLRGPQGQKGDTGAQGPEGPQGPIGIQGPIGPVGPVGPKGDVGDAAILDEKVSNVNAWSSKQIIDHLLQDNTWRDYNDTRELVNAANGYIKGLEIEGQTLKNLVIDGKKANTQRYIVEYEIEKTKSNTVYTVVGQLENVIKGEFKYGLSVSIEDSAIGNMATPRVEFKDGIFKTKITTKNEASCINFWTSSKDEGQRYTIKNVTVLEGDYTQKDVPDFIEGVQGVGLKTEKGYKIGVKTHGKNLLNLLGAKKQDNSNLRINNITLKSGNYVLSNKISGSYSLRVCKMGNPVTEYIVNTTKATHQFNVIDNGEYYLNVYKINIQNDELKNIQLEEGTQATKYEPYKESTSEIILDRQLMTGDKLTYDNAKGKYMITLADKQVIDTQIKAELLPETYKNKTYITKDMGVNGTLSGTYPEEIDFTKAVVKVLTLYGVQMTPPQQPPVQDEPTTLEEFEIDEPTTLEELTDEPTTLEEV